MNLPPARFRLLFHWTLPGLLAGLALGATGGWWLSWRQAGARRPAGVMAEGLAGPRLPPPPAGGRAGAGSATAGGAVGAGSIPVVELADNLKLSIRALMDIADPAVRQVALSRFLEKLPVERWPEFLAASVEAINALFSGDDDLRDVSSWGIAESALYFMMKHDPEGFLNRAREQRTGSQQNAASGQNTESELSEFLVPVGLLSWAGHDLPAAMAYFETTLGALPPARQGEAAAMLAREFVKKDPAAAFAWIKGLPKDNQDQVVQGAFRALWRTDPEAARGYLLSEKELPNRGECAERMASDWAATSPGEALAWAKGLPEELSSGAVSATIRVLAHKDFSAAIGETAALAPARQDAALSVLANTMAGRPTSEPSQVLGMLQLVDQAPEAPGRAEAARITLKRWTETDPEASSSWVAAQPDGPTHDAAIEGFGSAAVATKVDPEAALEWTAVISGQGARRNSLEQNVREWAAFDAASARAWVQSSSRLSEADREVLLPLTRR